MSRKDISSFDYICEYTIVLLPEVKEDNFEKRMVSEIMPRTLVSRRNFAQLSLDHRLMKRESNNSADSYVWQIRILAFRMVSEPTEYEKAFRAIDEDVREGLIPFGIPIKQTILREIGNVVTK